MTGDVAYCNTEIMKPWFLHCSPSLECESYPTAFSLRYRKMKVEVWSVCFCSCVGVCADIQVCVTWTFIFPARRRGRRSGGSRSQTMIGEALSFLCPVHAFDMYISLVGFVKPPLLSSLGIFRQVLRAHTRTLFCS